MTDNMLLNELRDIFRYRHHEEPELRLAPLRCVLCGEPVQFKPGTYYSRDEKYICRQCAPRVDVPVDPYDSDEMPSE